jgi:hypothetical protein
VCYFCDGADGGTRTRTLENEKQIFVPPRLSPPPWGCSWSGLSLRLGPRAVGAARLVSTPSSYEAWLGIGVGYLPLAFPDFERFYSQRFRWGTPIEVCCVYRFRHVRITRDFFVATWFNIQRHHSMPQIMQIREFRALSRGPRPYSAALLDREWVFILTPSIGSPRRITEWAVFDDPIARSQSRLWTGRPEPGCLRRLLPLRASRAYVGASTVGSAYTPPSRIGG